MYRVACVVALAVVAVVAPAPARAQGGPTCELSFAAGVSEQTLTSSGQARAYRLFVPPGADRRALPLVLDLHGSGGNATGQARTSGLEALAAREGFAVATLNAVDALWNVPVQADRASDVVYASDVIDHVAARVCIDQTRVYSTGFSGGARMTSLLACRLGARLAAVAPVAGLRWPAPCDGRPVPVLTFHGLADRQNTYEGGVEGRQGQWIESVPEALAGWADHNGCDADVVLEDPAGPLSTMRYEGCAGGAEVRLIRIDDLGHTWPRDEVDATEAMWAFFRSHRLAP
jgi:polyhydroxybutyrate depolymerase